MWLTRKQSTTLKGIAVFMVLIGHGFSVLTNNEYVILNWAGALGVAIFLMVSGYGLMESYKERGIDGKFLLRRIKTVMIPYWIMMIIETFIDHFVFSHDIPFANWILCLLGIVDYSGPCIDSTMWYITFLMCCYIIFFMIFSIKKLQDKYKVLLLVSITLICFYLKLYMTNDWLINYFSFTIGVLISFWKDKIRNEFNIFIIALSIFCMSANAQLVDVLGGDIIVWRIYALAGGITFLFGVKTFEWENSFLCNIGEASLFIYLVEGILLDKYNFYIIDLDYVNLCMYILFSILFGELLYKLYMLAKKNLQINR